MFEEVVDFYGQNRRPAPYPQLAASTEVQLNPVSRTTNRLTYNPFVTSAGLRHPRLKVYRADNSYEWGSKGG